MSAKDQLDVHSSMLEVVECLEMNACCCLVMRLAVSRAEDMASLIIDSIMLRVVHVKDIGL